MKHFLSILTFFALCIVSGLLSILNANRWDNPGYATLWFIIFLICWTCLLIAGMNTKPFGTRNPNN